MGLFSFSSKKNEGGLMDIIRCDEQEYLVWKWRPVGQEANSTNKENSIRWGSSLRVKEGEVAVFVYKQKDGSMQDFIEGPFDQIIKTDNFPVLANILGAAYNGASPFQAEVYFINLAGLIDIKFGVPYFDVFDPRFSDFAVPMAARGSLKFNITDYRAFIKLHRLINFDLEDFKSQIKDAVVKYTKSFIANTPADNKIPVLQIERKVLEISDLIQNRLKADFENDFGVNLKRFDLSAIEPDKESEGYQSLMRVTKAQHTKNIEAQTNVGIKNMQDMQSINAQNMEETLRIQREEAQRAQRLQTETNFMGAHALDQQTAVLQTAANNLGQMATMNMGNGGGMNSAGMMTGMMMGGAMGGQMANMMNQFGNVATQQMNSQMNTPPPTPTTNYMVVFNGQQSGPYNMQQLQQLAQSGQLTSQTYVWKQGMENWTPAGQIQELTNLFAPTIPNVPPTPPVL